MNVMDKIELLKKGVKMAEIKELEKQELEELKGAEIGGTKVEPTPEPEPTPKAEPQADKALAEMLKEIEELKSQNANLKKEISEQNAQFQNLKNGNSADDNYGAEDVFKELFHKK